ncbi:MAG: PIG-L family deacetylase [Thermoflexales bacterium]|nr:PIG-L family deacetylase [Thermoflexales bacterium]
MQVLLILAHPDDPEFFCGATLAKWAREGKNITYLLASCGDKGSDDPTMTPEVLCADRQVEQHAAAAIIGARQLIFLRYADGELFNTLELRRELVRAIRRYKPDIIVTCDPTTYFRANAYINHSDHRTIGAAALDAVFPAAGNRMYFPELLAEGLEPHSPREIWFSLTNEPNTWVDVTDTIDVKLAALREHKSQIKDPLALEQRVRERLRQSSDDGRECYEESFRVIKL